MSKRVRLGRSELQVSPICYGCWQASKKFWGDVPAEDLIAAMRRAFEVGVNFYDTADAYGDGESERLLGRAVAELPRGQIVVATKVYHHFHDDGRRHPDLSGKYVIEECHASLKRMGMDYVDLYQLHAWEPMTPLDETTAALERLRKDGKIRAYGASNFTVEQIRAARRAGDYSTLQPRYSLLDREIEADLLPYCQAEDMGVLCYSSLSFGMLTGKFDGTESFTDLRATHPRFAGEKFRKLAAAVRSLKPMAEKYGLTITQLALAATLAHPAITCPIVGIKNPAQIEEAAGAIGKTIQREDYYKIRDTLRE